MPVENCSTCGCPKSRWLRPETVAKALAISPRHVRNLLADGSLRGIRVGKRCWRVDHCSVHALFARTDNRADETIAQLPDREAC